MELPGDCLKSLTNLALAAGTFALGAVGLKFAGEVLALVSAGKDLALDLGDAQRKPVEDLSRRVEAAVSRSYETYLKESRSEGRNEADIRAALATMSAALAMARPTIADFNRPKPDFARDLLARLPPSHPCAATKSGRTLFLRLVDGVRTLATLDPDLQPHFAAVRWEATVAAFDAARRHREEIAETQRADMQAMEERLVARLAAEHHGVGVNAFRRLFEAVERELPEASGPDLERAVTTAIDELLARAAQKPEIFQDGEEIRRAIELARERLRQLDPEGALAHLRQERNRQAEERRQRQRGEARLAKEEGDILKTLYRWDEALAAFRQAADLDDENPSPWLVIGGIRLLRGHLGLARDAYDKARDIAAAAGAEQHLAMAHQGIGDVLIAEGRLAEARTGIETALDILRRRATADPADAGRQRDMAAGYDRMGDVLLAERRLPEARQAFDSALEIIAPLAEAGGDQAQRDLAVAYEKVGALLLALDKPAAAGAMFEHTIATRRRLVDAEPHNSARQHELAVSYEKLGDALRADGKPAGARRAFEASLDMRRRLAAMDPLNTQWQRDLGLSYNRIGSLLVAEGKLAEARKTFEQGLDIAKRLARAAPKYTEWQRDLSVFYNLIGDVLVRQDKPDEARAIFGKDLEIARRLAEAAPQSAERQQDLMISHFNLGEQGATPLEHYTAALAIARRLHGAGRLDPDYEELIAIIEHRLADLSGPGPAASPP